MPLAARQLAFEIEGLPREIVPMQPFAAPQPFDSSRWIFEADWGGIRALAFIGNGEAALSVGGEDATERFPELARALVGSVTVGGVILDGELVCRDQWGKPRRGPILQRLSGGAAGSGHAAPAFHARDILYHGYRPQLGLPLVRRKALLDRTVVPTQAVQPAYVQDTQGCLFFEAALNLGMEGIFARRKGSLYRPGERSRDWLQIRERRASSAVICGYTLGERRGRGFDELVLGAYDNGALRYVGNVGGGFSRGAESELARLLPSLHRLDAPLTSAPEVASLLYWCEPAIVVEVEYGELSPSGILRFPRFTSLRNDLQPGDCLTPAAGVIRGRRAR